MFTNNQRRTLRSLEHDVGSKFEFISAPAVEDVLRASADQVVATLAGVHPESVKFFTPTAQKIIDEQGTRALAAAIAQLSGFSRPPSSRSLITHDQEQLRHEMVVEINKLGRVSVIDLEDTTGVDLFHVEKQAQHIVSHDSSLMLINGEIISNWYWDNIAEDINERLQECSQIALAEIAAQFQVGSELLVSVLEPRLGNLVKGRLEGGQLYTPAYVARVNAMVRGAARGLTVPTNLSALWNSLQLLLQEMDGASGVAVEGSVPYTYFAFAASNLS